MEKGKQMRFSDAELNIIKATFKGNEALLKLLRKVFLPEYDPNAPFGQVIDLWMTIDLNQLPQDEAIRRIYARNTLISHIEQQIMQLNILAEAKDETDEEKKDREKKDSSK
jgi:hypothetical protein